MLLLLLPFWYSLSSHVGWEHGLKYVIYWTYAWSAASYLGIFLLLSLGLCWLTQTTTTIPAIISTVVNFVRHRSLQWYVKTHNAVFFISVPILTCNFDVIAALCVEKRKNVFWFSQEIVMFGSQPALTLLPSPLFLERSIIGFSFQINSLSNSLTFHFNEEFFWNFRHINTNFSKKYNNENVN